MRWNNRDCKFCGGMVKDNVCMQCDRTQKITNCTKGCTRGQKLLAMMFVGALICVGYAIGYVFWWFLR